MIFRPGIRERQHRHTVGKFRDHQRAMPTRLGLSARSHGMGRLTDQLFEQQVVGPIVNLCCIEHMVEVVVTIEPVHQSVQRAPPHSSARVCPPNRRSISPSTFFHRWCCLFCWGEEPIPCRPPALPWTRGRAKNLSSLSRRSVMSTQGSERTARKSTSIPAPKCLGQGDSCRERPWDRSKIRRARRWPPSSFCASQTPALRLR